VGQPLKFTKEMVLCAIRGTYGNVSEVAKVLDGCTWETAKRYIMRWEETRVALAAETERALDFSESMMRKAIEDGDGKMIRFHLSTKGKNRGYSTRTEVTGANGEAVGVKHGFSDDSVANILGILADAGALEPGAEEGGDPAPK
jgi:hypothetical protein